MISDVVVVRVVADVETSMLSPRSMHGHTIRPVVSL
jgi:hypothetical protein